MKWSDISASLAILARLPSTNLSLPICRLQEFIMSAKEKQNVVPDTSNKDDVMMIESASGSETDLGFDEKLTKKLVRKIDVYLVPFLSLLYLLSYLDRTNIGNARLGGIEADLGMSGLDYNVSKNYRPDS